MNGGGAGARHDVDGGGRVFDLGYRRYAGAREGRARARRALFANGVRTCFGLGRGAWQKALMLLFFGAAMAPAAFLIIVNGLFSDFGGVPDIIDLPGADEYYRNVSPVLLVFAAIIAPELLCPDRRDGVIHLYFARPLTAADYVIGRWTAFFAVSLALIYSGQALLLAGLTMAAPEPLEYLRGNWLDFPRSLGAGAAVAVVTTTIPLAVAAFTPRRAYASVAVIGAFVFTGIAAAVLAESVGAWSMLIDAGSAQVSVNDIIFGTYDDSLDGNLPAAAAIGWYAVVAIVPAALLWNRYRRIAE